MLALIELSLNIEFTNWIFADIHIKYILKLSLEIPVLQIFSYFIKKHNHKQKILLFMQ